MAWAGGLGWWAGLESIFNVFKVMTFFNAFLKYLKGWAGGLRSWAGGLGWWAELVG